VHGGLAGIVLVALEVLRGRPTSRRRALVAGALSFGLELARGLATAFVESPGGVVALWPYSTSRLDPLHDHVRPWMVQAADLALIAAVLGVVLAAVVVLARRRGVPPSPSALLAPRPLGAVVAVVGLGGVLLAGRPGAPRASAERRPNVLV